MNRQELTWERVRWVRFAGEEGAEGADVRTLLHLPISNHDDSSPNKRHRESRKRSRPLSDDSFSVSERSGGGAHRLTPGGDDKDPDHTFGQEMKKRRALSQTTVRSILYHYQRLRCSRKSEGDEQDETLSQLYTQRCQEDVDQARHRAVALELELQGGNVVEDANTGEHDREPEEEVPSSPIIPPFIASPLKSLSPNRVSNESLGDINDEQKAPSDTSTPLQSESM